MVRERILQFLGRIPRQCAVASGRGVSILVWAVSLIIVIQDVLEAISEEKRVYLGSVIGDSLKAVVSPRHPVPGDSCDKVPVPNHGVVKLVG